MGRKELILITSILATAAIAWLLFWPAYQSMAGQKFELNQWQEKTRAANDAKTKAAEIKADYEKLKSDAERATSAIPAEQDRPSLLVQFEDMTSQNGLMLNKIDFSEEKISSGSAAKVPAIQENQPIVGQADQSVTPTVPKKNFKTVNVALSLSGDLNGLKNFIEAMENNLRLMDVVSFSFNSAKSSQDSQAGIFDCDMAVNAYYR